MNLIVNSIKINCFKKLVALLYLVLFIINIHSAQAQEITGNWTIHKSVTVYNNKTTLLYEKEGDFNKIDLSKIAFIFDPNGNYNGFDVMGNTTNGTWNLDGDSLIIDGKTSTIDFLSDSLVIMNDTFEMINPSGDTVDVKSEITISKLPDNGCPNLISHENVELNSDVYQAKNINTKAIIETDSIVHYKAEQSIEMESGFEVKDNGALIAEIEGCPNPP